MPPAPPQPTPGVDESTPSTRGCEYDRQEAPGVELDEARGMDAVVFLARRPSSSLHRQRPDLALDEAHEHFAHVLYARRRAPRLLAVDLVASPAAP